MRLTIFSHWEGKTWTGEIPDPTDAGTLPANADRLEYIFRFFNRVGPGDNERLEAIGYRLPSLSVDDLVRLENGSTWVCADVGWLRVVDDTVVDWGSS